jgi:hypothetical protein
MIIKTLSSQGVVSMPKTPSTLALTASALLAIAATPSHANPFEPIEPDALSQVTSVSQLRDVQPTDWAFQALQSLVERYGCIAGYPDGTFRGNRPLTRYEFAAGLNACLDRITELVDGGNGLNADDLATIRRLQEEFQAELATLRGRVDALEARTAELEANQFSTTTKLRGEVSFSAISVFGDEKADGSGGLEEVPVFNDRVRLFFNTSFTGRDRLITRLDALNSVPFSTDITGTPMTRTAFDEGSDNAVRLGKLMYRFPIGDRLLVSLDATGGEYQGNVNNSYNPFFREELSGAISRFGRFNPIYYQGLEGAGATLTYFLGDNLNLSLGYMSPDANDPSEKSGLFNGRYAALAQLGFDWGDSSGLGLTYVRSYFPGDRVVVSSGTGSQLANAPFGQDTATASDQFGVQTSLRLSRYLNLSGWAGLTLADAESGGREGDEATIWNWAVALAFPDLGKEGSVAGLIVGQPPKVTDNDGGVEDDDTAFHIEASYRYPINDNILLNPGAFVILNPEHDDDNDAIWVATLRTIFEF